MVHPHKVCKCIVFIRCFSLFLRLKGLIFRKRSATFCLTEIRPGGNRKQAGRAIRQNRKKRVSYFPLSEGVRSGKSSGTRHGLLHHFKMIFSVPDLILSGAAPAGEKMEPRRSLCASKISRLLSRYMSMGNTFSGRKKRPAFPVEFSQRTAAGAGWRSQLSFHSGCPPR